MAQTFPESIEPGDYNNFVLPMPPSPLSQQILFIGGVDLVQTTATYDAPAGQAVAKQWHDFIGFTPCAPGDDCAEGELGWVSINHERIESNDKIGDGGGMTVFKVARSSGSGDLIVVPQVLDGGREGKFFNVDFVNTVGETGMNCGGITSLYDGRIWTAEEWFRRSTNSYFANGEGVRDTADFTVSTDIPGDFAGTTINKVDNFNWMVEIDPRQAVAIRKQYNWGRQGFEGGVVMPDNKTAYFGEDSRPGLFCRFIADEPGDFTKGTLAYYAYDEEAEKGYWVDYDSESFAATLSMNAYNTEEFNDGSNPAFAGQGRGALPWRGEDAAAMFIRNEWFAADSTTGLVYWTETGNSSFWDEFALFTPRGINNPEGDRYIEFNADGEPTDFNGKIGSWTLDMARMRFPELENVSNDSVRNWLVQGNNFRDAHGRVLCYDPATEQTFVFLEGGPYPGDDNSASVELGGGYPEKHLSNPDGLSMMYLPNGKRYMVICEDLNQSTWNSVPAGVSNRTCELWLLDMDMEPKVENLIRISQVPNGAEVTGAQATADGISLLVNSQHPRSTNPFPFNNSLTYAINGFDKLAEANDIQVTALKLYDANTQELIAQLDNGDRIQLSNLDTRELTVIAESNAESVQFRLSGAATVARTESFAPFALFADDLNGSGELFGGSMPAGEYTLTATPFTGDRAEGAAGLPVTVTFELVEGAATAVTTVAKPEVEFVVNNIESSLRIGKGMVVNAAVYNQKGQKVNEVAGQTAVMLEDFRGLGSVIVAYEVVETGYVGSIKIDFGAGNGAATTETFERVDLDQE